MKLLVVTAIALSLTVFSCPPVSSGMVSDIVFDPTNYSENTLTAARALKSNLNEARTLLNQALQLENEARNLARFPVDYWNRVQVQLSQLKALSEGSATLGEYLRRVNSQFDSIYPGYQAVENYGDAVKTWTSNAMKMSSRVFETAEKQSRLVEGTMVQTQEIVAESAAGVGLVQQVQSQIALSAQMVAELQKLQQLQSAQSTLQSAYIAGQTQREAVKQKMMDDWIEQSRSYKYH